MNRSGIFPYVDLQGPDMALATPSHSPRRQGTPSRSRTPSKRDILDRAAIDRLAREVRRTRPDSPTSPGGHGRSRTPERRYEARAMQQRTRSVSRDGRLKASLRNSVNSSTAVAKARPQSRPRQPEPAQQQSRRRSSQRRQEAPDLRRSWQDPSRARPWDERGYCPVHPDVRLAKKKRGGGWAVKLAECPKCLREKEQSGREDTASVTSSDESEEEGRGRARSHSLRSKSSKGRSRSRARQQAWGRKGSEGSGPRRSRRSQTDAHDGRQSPKPARRRSFSLSSRSRKGGRGARGKNRVPKCVNGAPFDKHGRCFDHPQVKLASKRLLGGWKIHMELCPLCERDGEYGSGSDCGSGSEYEGSVASGTSQLSFDSRHSGTSARSGRSMRSANASVASRQSRGSVRSFASKSSRGSDRSTSSWSSGGSGGRRVHRTNSKDESFLPLDEEGYCLRHPDVQLAQMSRRGGLKIIMDFCPECAEESLARGGSGGSREIVAKRNTSTESVCSSHHSRRSSFRSDGSSSTYIERMPYVDGEGHPGHYTGHVDEEGQPDGEGKLRYINGDKYDGIWHGGTKLHGKTTKSRRKSKDGRREKGRRPSLSTTMSPGPAPMPPPPFPGSRAEGRQRSEKDARRSGEHRRARRDAPGDAPGRRPQHDEGSSESSSRGKRGTVHRLRRKCDEIDALLKECPAPAHERKDSMGQID